MTAASSSKPHRNRTRPALAALAAFHLAFTPAAAQEPPLPPAVIPLAPGESPFGSPSPIDPSSGLPVDPGLPEAAAPYAPPAQSPSFGLDLGTIVRKTGVVLSAKLTPEGRPLAGGLVWRVFSDRVGPDGRLPLVAQGTGGEAMFELDPGVYLIYCGFGHAGTTVRVEVRSGLVEEAVVLNAGGLRLTAATSEEEQTLPSDAVRFDVYSLETDERGERKIVARDVMPGDLLRLAGDTYHVISRYGHINAMTRADVEVKSGKLTEVTLYQRAAEVTLKLVGEPGGEAIADTRWSVLTPGGDIVTEGVGAFPSFILAAGEYTVIAKHGNDVFEHQFDVESGIDSEVEVIASR